MKTVTIIEQCGAHWIAEQTGLKGERAIWVRLQVNSPRSIAKPGCIGFYAASINAACDSLNN